ncbi:MAG: hypothetical protein V4632_01595 [Pseudomonadota bacterium]
MDSQYSEYKPPSYPVVAFLVRHGILLSILAGVLPILAGVYFMLSAGSVIALCAGVAGGFFAGGLMLSYIEVLRIVSDTLIPK